MVSLYGLAVASVMGVGLYPRHFVPRGEPQASIYIPYHLSGNRPFIDLLMSPLFIIVETFLSNSLISIYSNTYYMVSLLHLLYGLTIASIIMGLTTMSHYDLFYGGRTISSSLRSSASEPQASLFTIIPLIGKSPFYRHHSRTFIYHCWDIFINISNSIYWNTYFYNGLTIRGLTIAYIIWSHCDLFCGGRTISSSLRSSGGEPQASIYIPYHLSGNHPFVGFLVIILMPFYFYILRPFVKYINIYLFKYLYYKGLIIAYHYRVSLWPLLWEPEYILVTSFLGRRAAGEHIYTPYHLSGNRPFIDFLVIILITFIFLFWDLFINISNSIYWNTYFYNGLTIASIYRVSL
jgi:hypothetical protein